MSTLKVDAIRHNSATSDAITTAADGTCTAKITGRTGGGGLSHRNLIINGAMNVAQRATSSTASGIRTVDRFAVFHGNVSEAPTQSQSDVGLSDLPFTEQGITKCFKVTNGNQTSTDSNDYIEMNYKCEAQDIRNSGWNYQSSSSFITLSYYVRSSVAQTYTAWITNRDGTRKNFVWSYALSANTWTKITKVIPGDSGLTINNDSGAAFEIWWQQYYGTNYTQASPPGHNTGGWVNHDNETVIDNTATWYETNDATFELTGVQLEVGNHATSFEHRSFGEELLRCQRYCYADRGTDDYHAVAQGSFNGSSTAITMLYTPVCMRAAPTLSYPVGTWIVSGDAGTLNQSNIYPTDNIPEVNAFQIRAAVSGAQSGEGFLLRTSSAAHTWILDAEL
tara:strand:+ start:673 stop:1851 length:1179 start_codon:yes stop_codon:yes gene_type:complete